MKNCVNCGALLSGSKCTYCRMEYADIEKTARRIEEIRSKIRECQLAVEQLNQPFTLGLTSDSAPPAQTTKTE